MTGHLFQARYGSAAIDEEHLVAAARYVSLNPVRARPARRAQDWRWSSVRAHISGDHGFAIVGPLLERCASRFADLLENEPSVEALSALRAAETIGRPIGASTFLDGLAKLGRDPRAKKRGQKGNKGFSKVSP